MRLGPSETVEGGTVPRHRPWPTIDLTDRRVAPRWNAGTGGWSEEGRLRVRELTARAPDLSRRRIILGRVLIVMMLIAGAHYLWWRVGETTARGPVGWGFLSAEVLSYAMLWLTAVQLLHIGRERPAPPAPEGTLDVLITVCGEPVEMVEQTLLAAMAIDYPHATYLCNDGWLAGRPGWKDIEDLARRYGVTCFTRTAGERGKAGNLNYALARTGSGTVCVLDADHLAAPDLAAQTLGHFSDPGVGFVVTPQQFDIDGPDLLNNHEPLFYRSMMRAKDAQDSAFSCGNGAVYRRTALQSVDGFSEWSIVEDVHTSLRMHAAGWHSVYHPRAVSIGQTPTTMAAFLKQRLTWATDGLRLLLHDNPLRTRGLSPAQRWQYLATSGFYAGNLTQLVFLAGPVLSLIGIPVIVASSHSSLLLHAGPYLGLLLAVLSVYAGGVRDGLRSLQSAVLLAPVCLLALIRASTGRRRFSGITEKARLSRISPLMVPHLLILAALSAVVVTAVVRPRAGLLSAAIWALLLSLLLVGPFVTSMVRTSRVGVLSAATRSVVGVLALGGLLGLPALAPGAADWQRTVPVEVVEVPADAAGTTAGRVTVREDGPRREQERPGGPEEHVGPVAPVDLPPTSQSLPAGPPSPPSSIVPPGAPSLTLHAPARGLYVGFSSMEPVDARTQVEGFAERTGLQARLVNRYQHWGAEGRNAFEDLRLEEVIRAGALPMVTWEPWVKPPGQVHDAAQPRWRLSRIAAGDHDVYLREWFRDAADFGAPIILRPMHEMNGFWYPWAVRANGNTPEDFVAAWRHLVDVAEEEGARNITWVWSVNPFDNDAVDSDITRYYPGRDYVDWLGLSVFNWGTSTTWGSWQDLGAIIGPVHETLLTLDQPIMLAELGTVEEGGDAAGWTRDTLIAIARQHPRIGAVLWFDADYPGRPDFRLGEAVDGIRRAPAIVGLGADPVIRLRADSAAQQLSGDPSGGG